MRCSSRELVADLPSDFDIEAFKEDMYRPVRLVCGTGVAADPDSTEFKPYRDTDEIVAWVESVYDALPPSMRKRLLSDIDGYLKMLERDMKETR